MTFSQEEKQPDSRRHNKKIQVNSILTPNVRHILRPCEARGGHGFISVIISLGIIGGALAVIYPLAIKIYKWLTG